MNIFRAIRGSHFNGFASVGSSITMSGLSGISDRNALVSSFNVTIGERAQAISCFDDFTYLFAFGHAPENSRYSIVLSVFLVDLSECNSSGYMAGGTLSALKSLFDTWKISKKKNLVTMSIGGVTLHGALVSMTIAGQDPELNMVSVRFDLLGVKDN